MGGWLDDWMDVLGSSLLHPFWLLDPWLWVWLWLWLPSGFWFGSLGGPLEVNTKTRHDTNNNNWELGWEEKNSKDLLFSLPSCSFRSVLFSVVVVG
jgi:hypothetical protein